VLLKRREGNLYSAFYKRALLANAQENSRPGNGIQVVGAGRLQSFS
jgi:hypothetical protein